METPKTSILQPTKLYPVGQATSDSKDSSTPGLTYSPNVPNGRKVHIPATPKSDLSSDSPRVVNTHPERRRLEFSKTQHEEQGTLPITNTPTLITRPAEIHSHDVNLAVPVAHRPGIQIIYGLTIMTLTFWNFLCVN